MLTVVAPPGDLAAAIEAGIVVRRSAAVAGAVWSSRFPAMPRAMLTVPFVAGQPLAPSFHALSTRPTQHRGEGDVHALGLVLRPAAAAQLLGVSTGALVDQVLPWAEVAGESESRRLQDMLAAAPTAAARLQALHDSVRRTLADALARGAPRALAARAEAVERLCEAVGRHGARAGPLLGLGERRLERRCRALLALSPKRMQRLVRFHAALSAEVSAALSVPGRRPRRPGADVALEAGYYDQSHLAREARLLAGEPLRDVLAGAHEAGAWWPLLAQRPLRHHR